MSWARFDDRCTTNPKVALLSDAAHRLWFTAICHSCEHLTDGRIDRDVPSILPRVATGAKLRAAISELERRGLWEVTPTGWKIHDFLDWNPSGDAVRLKREARAKAGRKGGINRSIKQAKSKQLLDRDLPDASTPCQAKPNPVPVPVPEVDKSTSKTVALGASTQNRARRLLANSFDAQFETPQDWPEVREAAAVIHEALGFSGNPKLGSMKDPAVKQILELFSAGFTLDEIREAAPRLLEHKFVSEVRRIHAVTPSVLRESLDGNVVSLVRTAVLSP